METHSPSTAQSAVRRWGGLASPFLIVAVGHLAARVFSSLLGQWAWVGVAVVYWGSLAATIALLGNRADVIHWLKPSQGSRLWPLVAIAIGLMPFPMLFLPNRHLLNSAGLILLWLAFGVLNSVFEEAYWRGYLLGTVQGIPRPVMAVLSNVIFTAIHPLMWGVFSRPMMVPVFWGITFTMGMVYALMFLRTRSLRWPIASHLLADLGNLSIFVFMNLIVVPGL